MHRTQIYLTSDEREQLLLIAEETEQYQSVLIREAIDQYIEGYRQKKQKKSEILDAAAGIWKNRKDLPDFSEIRKELDR
ncbi:MAG: CopG family transcriptional regulator [Parachlamydiaceae bacterium]|nr:CopG family transcriptional regulator [Parachlamydiaceae bacterium]